MSKQRKYKFTVQCLVSNDESVIFQFNNPNTPKGRGRLAVLRESWNGTSSSVESQETAANAQLIVVEGKAVVGKSRILKHLVEDCQIAAKFPDGRFYMQLGGNAFKQEVFLESRNILSHENGEKLANELQNSESLPFAIRKVTKLFSAEKRTLFMRRNLAQG